MDEIRLTIDGKEVTAERGMTVLEVARAADIYIPTLCYDEDLEPYGGCRLCVKGRFGIAEFVNHSQRLTTPLMRCHDQLL